MNSTTPTFFNDTVCISIAEFENLIECKKELLAIKEELKLFIGDD